MAGMKKPVLTLHECVAELRALGVRTSPNTIATGIERGDYPFGIIKSVGPTGRRYTEIYRVKFEAWVKETYGVEVAT